MSASVFSDTRCTLGEGALWHPERGELFWFDILGARLYTRNERGERHWQFARPTSAAGWVDRDRLLVADAVGLFLFDLRTGEETLIANLEADNAVTRSNDGRADPQGGFWIGTMGMNAEPKAGAIYRYYRGELRKLACGITIPNAICFTPDGSTAYYTDTPTHRILRQPLDAEGWPEGAPETFVETEEAPDGAIVDAQGCVWNAQWGAARVARYATDGTFLSAVAVPTPQASCPAFGGVDLTTLYVTTAAEGGLPEPAGQTFFIETETRGQAEHRVRL